MILSKGKKATFPREKPENFLVNLDLSILRLSLLNAQEYTKQKTNSFKLGFSLFSLF
jgi:hypothetical protein